MADILDESLQVFPILLFFHRLETFLQLLVVVIEGVSTHDTHVVNAVSPYMPKFADQEVSLLFRITMSVKIDWTKIISITKNLHNT